MCEWNYKTDGTPKEGGRIEDNILFMQVRRLVWHLTPWRHGPDCRWAAVWRH